MPWPLDVAGSLRITGALAIVIAGLACGQAPLEISGQLGRPFPRLSGDKLDAPRVAIGLAGCVEEPGGCSSYCDDTPQACAQRDAQTCMSLLIDTGTPVTAVSHSEDGSSLGPGCLELRAGAGLAGDDQAAALPSAVTRFRFVDAPRITLPTATPDGWNWQLGTDERTVHVGGVLGGNVLNDFAVLLRSRRHHDPTVAFFREFPGNEASLAADGRAFIPVQYPQQLVGVIAQDRCEIAGLDCELAGLDLDPDDERIIFESTRIVVDTCVAPPPCAPYDDAETGSCRLSPGGSTPEFGCAAADVGPNAGVNASLVVATGLPATVLFDDSAARMFGPLSQLPGCEELDAGTSVSVRACRMPEPTTLHIPGWPAIGPELLRLRVRGLALVPGLSSAAGSSPCARYERRLAGAGNQCAGFARHHQPMSGSDGEAVSSSGLVVFGETQWPADRETPDPARWLDVTIVAAEHRYANAIRRDVGSRPVQIDGLLGSALLQDTEVVVDYTEPSPGPGLRVTCLDPESTNCLTLPSCSDEADDIACCFGIPQSLLRRAIRDSALEPAPRREELCCRALSQESLDELAQLDPAVCEGVDAI